jgi:hypothetical protein
MVRAGPTFFDFDGDFQRMYVAFTRRGSLVSALRD